MNIPPYPLVVGIMASAGWLESLRVWDVRDAFVAIPQKRSRSSTTYKLPLGTKQTEPTAEPLEGPI